MVRKELIKEIATETGFTQKDVAKVLDVLENVTYRTIGTEEVKIMSGVTLYSKDVNAREARNPRTGETVFVDAKKSPKCKFGKTIKDVLNA